uniref:Uncharacterized protein n=1 Tax=Anopheles atroparvus TaxID=41427 RepID=A0A182IKL6_ANOAO
MGTKRDDDPKPNISVAGDQLSFCSSDNHLTLTSQKQPDVGRGPIVSGVSETASRFKNGVQFARGGATGSKRIIFESITNTNIGSDRQTAAPIRNGCPESHAEILLGGRFVRFPRDLPETGALLGGAIVGVKRRRLTRTGTRLLLASLVRVARLAEVGHKVEDGLVDAHILSRVVLREDRPSLDERQPEDVRQILSPDATEALKGNEQRNPRGKRETLSVVVAPSISSLVMNPSPECSIANSGSRESSSGRKGPQDGMKRTLVSRTPISASIGLSRRHSVMSSVVGFRPFRPGTR